MFPYCHIPNDIFYAAHTSKSQIPALKVMSGVLDISSFGFVACGLEKEALFCKLT